MIIIMIILFILSMTSSRAQNVYLKGMTLSPRHV